MFRRAVLAAARPVAGRYSTFSTFAGGKSQWALLRTGGLALDRTCRCAVGQIRSFHATRPASADSDDLYAKLGVPRTASTSDIKRAYYKAAKKYHPDTNKDDPAAAKKFADVTEAYEVLSDESKRQAYDAYGRAGIEDGPQGGPGAQGFPGGFANAQNMEELFEQFEHLFGGKFRQPGRRRGRDVQVQVELDLHEAAEGCKRKISWRSQTEGVRTIEAEIPAGIDSGINLRLSGEGEPGEAGRGHVYVAVVVREHEIFERDGNDLHVQVKLTLAEAVLGGSVIVPTLQGQVSLKVPPGTQPGDKRVMQGRGLKDLRGSGRGHQYVHFKLVVPRNVSERQKELIKEFGQEEEMDEEERSSRKSRPSTSSYRRSSGFG
uniref:J domain-containing protein n=1 Tax=Chrysotila carterae TaxID=13221 RepID=A0A7S4FBV8_CHRCT|mmetsp:Transcript_5567/g.12123  ORF Transcript_5567/g.12123 Transcript_5567/m.12123 type:complete len:376 (-) Transcript_5567:510-1637(-)